MDKYVKRIADELTKIRKLMEHQEKEKIINNNPSVKVKKDESIDVDKLAEDIRSKVGNISNGGV